MPRHPRLAATLALLAVLACGHEPQPARAAHQAPSRQDQLRDAARSIALCRTTDSALLRLLGRPSRAGMIHRDRVMSWLSPNDSLDRYLAVMLDSAGTVVDLYWDVPSEVPWVPTNQCAARQRE